jgi:selenocysteine lyase/cysteine desulfurase
MQRGTCPTWPSLDENPQALKQAFPVSSERPYFAHAGVAPISGAAAEMLQRYTHHACTDDQESGWIWAQLAPTRARIAGLLGAEAEEVSLIGPTAAGLGTVALGFPWKTGDAVLYHAGDYPANVYPWLDLKRFGVTAIGLEPTQPGVIDWPLIEQALTPQVRLVSLASCHYLSGYCPDLSTIGYELHQRGIKLCVDGIQTLGVRPLPLEHVDYVAADGHKWLLAPCGAGLLWVRASAADELHPPFVGAWNVHSPEFIAQKSIAFEAGARRFECGTLNLPGALALGASCEVLRQLDINETQQRIAMRHERLRAGLEPLGFRPVLSDTLCPAEQRGPMLSLIHPTAEKSTAAAQKLRAAGVAVSLRCLPDQTPVLRLAPHGYTSSDDCQRVIDLLQGSPDA